MTASCRLEVPKHVGMQKEPEGEKGEPLIMFVAIKVLGVRDVPDTGGSYEMDVK